MSLLEIEEKRLVTGPWVSQTFGQEAADLAWRFGLVRDIMNCANPFFISRKFFLSSLRFGCQIITIFSRVFFSCHIFPSPVSLPEQSLWQPKQRGLRSKAGGNLESPPWLSPKNPKENENIHLTGLLPFSCSKNTYYCSMTGIISSKKVFVLVSCTWWDVLC